MDNFLIIWTIPGSTKHSNSKTLVKLDVYYKTNKPLTSKRINNNKCTDKPVTMSSTDLVEKSEIS